MKKLWILAAVVGSLMGPALGKPSPWPITVSLLAQTQNHTDVVSSVKADLQARGVSLTGPCGAFEITKRVAWTLRGEGAGLLDKPSGNNCQGYAVDIIAYPDGEIVDMLTDSGGSNGPSWNQNGTVEKSRYRAAVDVDPGGGAGPVGPTTTPQAIPEATVDLSPVLVELAKIETQLETLKVQADQNTEKLQQQIDQAIKNAEKSTAPLIVRLLTLGIAK